MSGGSLNIFGNLASIGIPIVIGRIISTTGSFKRDRQFVGTNALVAVFSYLVVDPIKRLVPKEPPGKRPELINFTQAHS